MARTILQVVGTGALVLLLLVHSGAIPAGEPVPGATATFAVR